MPPNDPISVTPAELSFLAIYNPSLGSTDETLADQIVFYSSKESRERTSRSAQRENTTEQNEDQNEKLRRIGLAQGIVSFAKNFSNGEAADAVETEKSRIALHELEPGWWILASIDLTRFSSGTSSSKTSQSDKNVSPCIDYSSREVAPSRLILQQLLRAHSIFLLHHAPSLDALYKSLPRQSFCNILDRFWTRFIWNWDVLLNGNPAVDIFNGIKLAASGELGIGVGEEEWGSGEREVLEDFVLRTEGLADIIVSKFGDAPPDTPNDEPRKSKPNEKEKQKEHSSWVGNDVCPRSSDGVIFSGVGAISRRSLTRVSQWMEWVYRYGEDAYGVREDPRSTRRRKRRKPATERELSGIKDFKELRSPAARSPNRRLSPGIPPPLVVEPPATPKEAPRQETSRDTSSSIQGPKLPKGEGTAESSAFGTETFMKLLTLGYGSSWGSASKSQPPHQRLNFLRFGGSNDGDTTTADTSREQSVSEAGSTGHGLVIPQESDNLGRFIIGLRDDLEREDSGDEDGTKPTEPKNTQDSKESKKMKPTLRTLSVTMRLPMSSNEGQETHLDGEERELQVIIYLHQPFMFTFLFKPGTPSLLSPAFYRSIHHRFGPLQKPLLLSTSPDKASQRASLSHLYQGALGKDSPSKSSLYDIIFDPSTGFVHTSLPNIPEPVAQTQSSPSSPLPWTRLDALNVYTQILNTYVETRTRPSEIERTCKTNRGWWVLWMRLMDSEPKDSSQGQPQEHEWEGHSTKSPAHGPKEAFLARKASDHVSQAPHRRNVSGTGFFRDFSGASGASQASSGKGGWTTGPGKIAEGVGLDARRYIEALFNLNR